MEGWGEWGWLGWEEGEVRKVGEQQSESEMGVGMGERRDWGESGGDGMRGGEMLLLRAIRLISTCVRIAPVFRVITGGHWWTGEQA